MTPGGYIGTPTRERLTEPTSIAILGIALGALAFVLTIPPIEARNMVVPVLVGLLGMMAGVWAASRGAVRRGLLAIGIGGAGVVLGILATRSSASDLEIVFSASLIASMLVFATPLTFAAIGGMFSERSGVVNIGLEGMMLMGAFWAVYGADITDSWVGGLLIGVLAGGLTAAVHAVFSIHLQANQIVSGTAINFLALGITGYFYVELYRGRSVRSDLPTIPNVRIPFVRDMPYLGPAIGNLNLMVWFSFLLVIVAGIVVFKTPIGLRLRACGEHPRAADTVGINVYAVRYGAVITSGMLAAAGGAYLSIGFGGGIFTENMTAGRGFIALAALIFGNWRPGGAFAAALLFGFATALAYRLPVYSESAATLFQTLPYILTLIAVAGVLGRSRPPAAVGEPYVRQ